MEHLIFRVLDESGTRVVSYEVLEVVREAANRVRLTHSPAFVAGVARGDLLELDSTLSSGFRIVEHGGMIAATIVFVSLNHKRAAERLLGNAVQPLGGVCDGGPGRALVFNFPVSAGFPALEAFLNEASARFPGAEWYFGNVYGADGAPLNWWAETDPGPTSNRSSAPRHSIHSQ